MSFRADVFVNKGEPIYIKPFFQVYLQNKPEGIKLLLNQLASSMSALILNIPTENYDEIFREFEKVRSRGKDLKENFEKDKVIIQGLINGESFPESKEIEVKSSLLWFRRIVTLPLYIIALISNFIPELVLKYIVRKSVSDVHFHDSIAYAGGFFLFSFLYAFQALVLYFLIDNAAIAFFYLLIIPFISKFYYTYLYDKQ